MSLRSKYQDFLANPTTGALAANAALAYVPTLTVVNEPTAILKHYAAQAKQVRKKGDRFLSVIESSNGLCVESETTLEFLTGGGAYLPALDDNFLADKTVIFPIVHIVTFDQTQAISSIRLHWDQGSLLKQVEIIGSRARNWPIRDGKDQIRIITSTAISQSPAPSRPSTQSGQLDEVVITRRSHASSTASSNAMNDPKATLSLFQPLDTNQEERVSYGGPVVSPRASAKPTSRNLADILTGTENEPEVARSGSPTKQVNGGAPKGGAGKNYHPIRLFEDEQQAAKSTPFKDIKTDPKKYTHFEFGEPEMPPPPKPSVVQAQKAKHGSQWDFADFETPEKPKMKVRTHDVRHFGWSDDEEDQQSPVRRPVVHQPRPDAVPHFEFKDDGTPAQPKPHTTQKGRLHNDGLDLYKDNVFGAEDEGAAGKKQPLAAISGPNVDLGHRGRDFGAHYEIADSSPSVRRTTDENAGNSSSTMTTTQPPAAAPPKKMDENRAKVLKGLNATWNLYDEPANVPAAGAATTTKKENNNPVASTTTSNPRPDGGRRGTERHWGFGGDDGDGEAEEGATAAAKMSKRKGEELKSFWDF